VSQFVTTEILSVTFGYRAAARLPLAGDCSILDQRLLPLSRWLRRVCSIPEYPEKTEAYPGLHGRFRQSLVGCPGRRRRKTGPWHVSCNETDAGAAGLTLTFTLGTPDPNAGQVSRVRPEKTQLPTRELEKMSDSTEREDTPKNRSWMYLVAAFIVLIAIGILTT